MDLLPQHHTGLRGPEGCPLAPSPGKSRPGSPPGALGGAGFQQRFLCPQVSLQAPRGLRCSAATHSSDSWLVPPPPKPPRGPTRALAPHEELFRRAPDGAQDKANFVRAVQTFGQHNVHKRGHVERIFIHYPRQQECGIAVLEQMENHGEASRPRGGQRALPPGRGPLRRSMAPTCLSSVRFAGSRPLPPPSISPLSLVSFLFHLSL